MVNPEEISRKEERPEQSNDDDDGFSDDDDDGDDGDVGHSLISTVRIFLMKKRGSAYQVIQCPWHIFGRVLLKTFTCDTT